MSENELEIIQGISLESSESSGNEQEIAHKPKPRRKYVYKSDETKKAAIERLKKGREMINARRKANVNTPKKEKTQPPREAGYSAVPTQPIPKLRRQKAEIVIDKSSSESDGENGRQAQTIIVRRKKKKKRKSPQVVYISDSSSSEGDAPIILKKKAKAKSKKKVVEESTESSESEEEGEKFPIQRETRYSPPRPQYHYDPFVGYV